MKNLQKSWQCIVNKGMIWLALKMSLIVGTILNCINQGDCLVAGRYEDVEIGKLLITYSVPFFVSLYTSIMVNLKQVNKLEP